MGFGVITLLWHEYNGRQLSTYLACLAGIGETIGGVAIQFRRSAKAGAIILSAVYLVFTILCLPAIFSQPLVYNSYGNFFEQLSLVTGPALVLMQLASLWPREAITRMARLLLGACTASFALEQAFYLDPTAGLVPRWIPPNQLFWAITTTALFALTALALLSNRVAVTAARLLTAMLTGFGVLVWIPVVAADRHHAANWSEMIETFAIAGTAWIVADVMQAREIAA